MSGNDESPDDGGHAFPLAHGNIAHAGMSLRKWYAGQAIASGRLNALASEREIREMFGDDRTDITEAEILANRAFELADAMIAEGKRSKGGTPG